MTLQDKPAVMPQIEKFMNLLKGSKELAYDVETNGLDWRNGFVCGHSVSDGQEAFYIPVRHAGGGNIINIDAVERDINANLCEGTKRVIGHHIKFDKHFAANHKIDIGNNLADTMVTEALLDENRNDYSLDGVCKSYSDVPLKKGEELYAHIARLFGCLPNRKSMAHYYKLAGTDSRAVEYAAGDTLSTYRLFKAQEKQIEKEELKQVFDMECKLISVLFAMERRGIRVDIEESKRVKKQIDTMLDEAYSNLPLGTNVNSPFDLIQYFEYAGISDWPMTAKGNPSFNSTYLKSHPEGEIILTARKLRHFENSFLEPLERHIFKERIHTDFNQTAGDLGGTRTGRLSSRRPNMQQIPKRDEFVGKIYRRMFIPDYGMVFVELDHSQAEPRLYSHYSEEPILLNGYKAEPYIDMHSIASDLLGVPRGVAKNLNLGILYYMGKAKLGNLLGITFEEAENLLQRWYSIFPNVKDFRNFCKYKAEQHGFVKTILGRRRRFSDTRWAYKAANARIQGSSADIIKWKMIELENWCRTMWGDDCQMLLSIHDSLLFQIDKQLANSLSSDGKPFADWIADIMSEVQKPPFNLRVPFRSNYLTGNNWSEASYGT